MWQLRHNTDRTFLAEPHYAPLSALVLYINTVLTHPKKTAGFRGFVSVQT